MSPCTPVSVPAKITWKCSALGNRKFLRAVLTLVIYPSDVLVLCIAFSSQIASSMYQKTGTQTRTKYINMSQIANALGKDICMALTGMHALTDCNTVSAFAGRDKVSALKVASLHPAYREALKQLGDSWDLSDALFKILQGFTCSQYNSRSPTIDVNELRYKLFCAKKGQADSWQLPPCEASVFKHCLLANYQADIWKRFLESCPDIPTLIGHG